MLEGIKRAMISHIPIVYIPTDQLELIQELFYGNESADAIIPRISYDSNEPAKLASLNAQKYSRNENYVVNGNVPTGCSETDNPKVMCEKLNYPTLYLNYVSGWEKINTSAKRFVYSYMGIKRNFPIDDNQTAMFRRSLFVVVTPKEQTIPEDLVSYTCTVHVPPISDGEIRKIISKSFADNEINSNVISNTTLLQQMVISYRGFSSNGIKQIMSQLIAERLVDNDSNIIYPEKVLETISEAKKQMLNNSIGLKWETPYLAEVAGLGEITSWLTKRSELFQNPDLARRFHIEIPQGLLVSGVPGTGKSLVAKTAAGILKLPLISMDMGALLGGLMGESEHNLINALAKAEQMSPCVLWIDEIEKAFSGSSQNSSSSDGGVSRRMFGKFLTWMQEKTASCFVFATSNDISCLPPELFRSERFDGKFFTFMPMAEECAAMLSMNIKNQNSEYKKEQLQSKASKYISLFSSELETTEYWLNILNEYCCNKDQCLDLQKDNNNIYGWKNNEKPRFKLMTGADLSALIKLAKFEVYNKTGGEISENVVYSKALITDAVKTILKGEKFKPYGETNIKDIVKCFKKLYDYEFVSASGTCVVDFSRYESDKGIINHDNTETILSHRYDKALYYMVVGAINTYSKNIEK